MFIFCWYLFQNRNLEFPTGNHSLTIFYMTTLSLYTVYCNSGLSSCILLVSLLLSAREINIILTPILNPGLSGSFA